MPSDDYTVVSGGGALKLKGARISKKKKKDRKKTINLEKSLAGSENEAPRDDSTFEKKKKVEDTEDAPVESRKTEAELRHEEARRKRLLEMATAQGARPELLKTHKQRVEELNTYLSKLSEHHDMPKIGPG